MYRAPIHRLLVLTTLVVALEACGPRAPSASSSPWSGALEQIRSAVVAAGGYSPERVEVTASPTLLRIAIGDASLAQADQLARENAAGAIVSAAETVLPQQEVFRSIQVISVARKPTPAPNATGRRWLASVFTMLAVIAASTRMHSSPSRNTRMPMSNIATVGLTFARVGSGEPPVVSPCQVMAPSTPRAATRRRIL